MIARKGVSFLWRFFLRLQKRATLWRLRPTMAFGPLKGRSNGYLGAWQALRLPI